MNFTLQPMLDYGLQPSLDLMNLGFSDYAVHIELTLPMFLHMLRVDSIDPSSSRIFMADNEPVGVGLIARRGWSCRLAAMSVIPAARRRGAGRAALNALLAEAAARAEHSMVLEVIESNTPAVELYTRGGFETERRLVSFEGSALSGVEQEGLQEIDVREAAHAVIQHGLANLPWQISGESLAQSGAPGKAFRLEDAIVAISNPSAEQVAVRTILVSPPARRQKQAARLLRAVFAKYPGKKWLVPALCPEEFSGLFASLGFQRDELSQLQMKRTM